MVKLFTKFKCYMSNILIIKHGSLGDIAQISGAIEDIKSAHNRDDLFILTTFQYVDVLSRCPFVKGVIIDERLPRWNILYLLRLKKKIERYDFKKIYDLQNSSRTSFYRKFLFNVKSWSSTETTIKKETSKKKFDKDSVLNRFAYQLNNSGVKAINCLKPDFSWSSENVDSLIRQYFSNNFILLFPFCSKKLTHKKWPYYNELITMIKNKNNKLEIAVAPGPDEIVDAKEINATIITLRDRALTIPQLSGLIKKSYFVISNDTGPAHMTAHLGKKGLAIFGPHTTPEKVSIETNNFKSIISNDLNKLSAEDVFLKIEKFLIN